MMDNALVTSFCSFALTMLLSPVLYSGNKECFYIYASLLRFVLCSLLHVFAYTVRECVFVCVLSSSSMLIHPLYSLMIPTSSVFRSKHYANHSLLLPLPLPLFPCLSHNTKSPSYQVMGEIQEGQE